MIDESKVARAVACHPLTFDSRLYLAYVHQHGQYLF
jgi:hypothetical protein